MRLWKKVWFRKLNGTLTRKRDDEGRVELHESGMQQSCETAKSVRRAAEEYCGWS